MKVYWLDHHPAYNSVEFKDAKNYEHLYSLFKDGKSHAAEWQPASVSFVNKNKPSDFLRTAGGSLVVSSKTKELFSKHHESLEFLPLQGDIECYILNVTTVVDCIDEANSKPKSRGIGGHLFDHFEEIALDLELVKEHGIFRMKLAGREEVFNDIFVTDQLKEEIEIRLEGFQLIEIWDSEFSWEQKEEKFKAMCDEIDKSLTETFEFGKAVKYVQKKIGKQAFSGKWSLKADEKKDIWLGQLQPDGTYSWINPIYYPPIILGLKWGSIEKENKTHGVRSRDYSSLEISGLGGWLVLVQIGLYGTLLLLLLQMANNSIPALGPGIWNELTSKESSLYDPLWGTLIIFELLSNILLFLFCVFSLIIMYRKKSIFPRLMIIFYSSNFCLLVIDYLLLNQISIAVQLQSPDSIRDLLRAGITCAIWIPYFLRSTRARNTFVR